MEDESVRGMKGNVGQAQRRNANRNTDSETLSTDGDKCLHRALISMLMRERGRAGHGVPSNSFTS